MKILELFAGTRSIGKTFEKYGHEVFSVDWDQKFEVSLHKDIEFLQTSDIPFVPDVIWSSPDCTTYSIAGISHHRYMDKTPKTSYGEKSDRMNRYVLNLMGIYKRMNPHMLYFIENPRGLLRKMPFMIGIPRYTVTYCQYGDSRMKPTDIFTNHPDPQFKPPCHNGDSCHESAPRGSQTGTQKLKKIDRSRIPHQLCEHIVKISEVYFNDK